MNHYLTTAQPVKALMPELEEKLSKKEFNKTHFLGKHITESLALARKNGDKVQFELPAFCILPSTTERVEILNHYFTELGFKSVYEGQGWLEIAELPRMFPHIEVEEQNN